MKKNVLRTALIFCIIIPALILSSCATKSSGLFTDDHKIPYSTRDLANPDGAASVERDADIKDSPYFVQKDFYNMKSTDTLTILTGFKTIQQNTEWTCGPTAMLMVLEWLGVRGDLDEMDLVDMRNKPEPGATNLRQMINIVEALNEKSDKKIGMYSTYDLEGIDINADIPEAPKRTVNQIPEDMLFDYLDKGIPVIIGWDDWGGHWTVVIGYDTVGDEDSTASHVLIVADPYDTTDHCQDGYVIQSFERLYYNWKNTFDPQFKNNVFLALYLED